MFTFIVLPTSVVFDIHCCTSIHNLFGLLLPRDSDSGGFVTLHVLKYIKLFYMCVCVYQVCMYVCMSTVQLIQLISIR